MANLPDRRVQDPAALRNFEELRRLATASTAQITSLEARATSLERVDQADGVGSLRTLGTGAQQAAKGNHTHAASFYSSFAAGADENIGAGRLRVTNNGTDLGSGWNMTQGPWHLFGSVLVRANSPNWTTILAFLELYTTGGGLVDSSAAGGQVQGHTGASADGGGWHTIHLSRIVHVPGGAAWMPRLVTHISGSFGAILSRGYTWSSLHAHKLDH